MAQFDTLEIPRTAFIPQKRINQRGILPTAVKTRLLGDIVKLANLTSASVTLNNGAQALFTTTTIAISGARIICVPDTSLYVGSVAAANQLPGGSSINESQWEVIFMGADWDSTDTFNTKTLVYVRNINAGDNTDVLIRVQSRVIVNTSIE